jgi:hypothetical protein
MWLMLLTVGAFVSVGVVITLIVLGVFEGEYAVARHPMVSNRQPLPRPPELIVYKTACCTPGDQFGARLWPDTAGRWLWVWCAGSHDLCCLDPERQWAEDLSARLQSRGATPPRWVARWHAWTLVQEAEDPARIHLRHHHHPPRRAHSCLSVPWPTATAATHLQLTAEGHLCGVWGDHPHHGRVAVFWRHVPGPAGWTWWAMVPHADAVGWAPGVRWLVAGPGPSVRLYAARQLEHTVTLGARVRAVHAWADHWWLLTADAEVVVVAVAVAGGPGAVTQRLPGSGSISWRVYREHLAWDGSVWEWDSAQRQLVRWLPLTAADASPFVVWCGRSWVEADTLQQSAVGFLRVRPVSALE